MIAGMPCNRRARVYAALAYRALFYVLVTSPLWGASLALAIAWHRVNP